MAADEKVPGPATGAGSGTGSGSGRRKRRQPAKRLFVKEIMSTREQVERDGVKFAVTPLGDEVNRVFLVAVALGCEEREDGLVRLRIADPTGGMSVWITDRTPGLKEKAMELADGFTPVAIAGKLRVVGENFTTIRAERIARADETTQKLWLRDAAERVRKLLPTAKDRELAEELLRAAEEAMR